MKINYGVWKTVDKKGISQNGSIDIDADWDSDEDHKRIRQAIRDKHPGYNIYGYCLADNNLE